MRLYVSRSARGKIRYPVSSYKKTNLLVGDMNRFLLRIYDQLILSRPLVTLLVVLALFGIFVSFIPQFKLDASTDSLILENDADLRYFRTISEQYSSNDILILTFSPKEDLFSEPSLTLLKEIRDDLRQLKGIASVRTILDVPLLFNTNVSLSQIGDKGKIKTLEEADVDLEAAKIELRDSPLYRNRVLSRDSGTTAILINLPIDQVNKDLLNRRYHLREKKYNNQLSPAETLELVKVEADYRQHSSRLTEKQNHLVESVREVVGKYRDNRVEMYLGGVPMIIADMIAFIRSDLVVFGVGVFLFLIITLLVIFRRLRWVILSMLCCLVAGLTMVGFLGMVDWRVTIISSNFISLMLIFTMSLTIHLIVRFRELHAQRPDDDLRALVLETVRLKLLPCLYTTLTTIVAFTSLLVSEIRPVMDFGLMMTIGLIVSFCLSFVLFPAGLLLFKKEKPVISKKTSQPFTLLFARFTEAHGSKIMLFSLVLAILSGVGIAKLKVENRFIDYFREKTEIYQGMKVIDRKLGGTTPLDLIIDFKEEDNSLAEFDEEDPFDDEIVDTDSQWYVSSYKMAQMGKIHDFLEALPETGEVLSIATAIKIATRLNGNVELDNFELAILHKKAPQDLKEILIYPFLDKNKPQARITMRVMESDKGLQRQVLLEKISSFLTGEMGFDHDQFHFTNMFVLYNNMLQSLFKSQILTIAMVFLGIMAMFMVLFRSPSLAVIAIIPNLLPAAMILGALGWLGIPLDMMTITIAAITIGIAVDDTIHYIHRFTKEFAKDRNYQAAINRCHGSIGRAMYYTSVTIIIGFSILVMSNFIPTIYFGLFTGFGMLVALLAALTLLPQLLITLKPLGPEAEGKKS